MSKVKFTVTVIMACFWKLLIKLVLILIDATLFLLTSFSCDSLLKVLLYYLIKSGYFLIILDWLLFAKETDTLGGLRFDFPKKEISSRPFFSVCAFFRHQQQQQQQQRSSPFSYQWNRRKSHSTCAKKQKCLQRHL